MNRFPLAKFLLVGLLIICSGAVASAQDIQSSALSRLGYGTLQSSVPVSWEAMGGVGVGISDARQINLLNPAGYAATDSLSFLIDLGVSLSYHHYREGGAHKNSLHGALDYFALQFPLYKDRLALAGGIRPFSNTGYSLSREVALENEVAGYRMMQNFRGSGSFQQLFVGLGSKVWESEGGSALHLGANLNYLFGSVAHYTHLVPNSTQHAQDYTEYSIRQRDLSIDLGMQYKFVSTSTDKDEWVLGATYSPSMPLHPTRYFLVNHNFGSQTKPEASSKKEQVVTALPHKVALGLSWRIPDKLLLAFDGGADLWSKVPNIFMKDGAIMQNSYHAAVGAEYRPDIFSRKYRDQIAYRAGLSYRSSYLSLPRVGQVQSLGVNMGLGMPIRNSGLERVAQINLTLGYQRNFSIQEKAFAQDILKLTLGVTFNETWFRKLKIY